MTHPLKALLVDDERPARKWLKELLSAYPEVLIVGEADRVEAAAELADREKPDVIFLDIQMPPGNGFDLLPQLRPLPHIVFVTAHDAFAIKAFEANALDYLLKPVHPARLAETIRRLHATAGRVPDAQSAVPLQVNDLVPLRDGGLLRMVTVGTIAAIQAEAAYSRVLLCEKEAMLILRRMGEWENLLPKPPFVRIERSLLINLDLIQAVEVKHRDKTCISLTGIPRPLQIGRLASARLRALLEN